jgi:hypothetical protein
VDQTLVGRPPQSEVFIEASLDLIKDYLGLFSRSVALGIIRKELERANHSEQGLM